MLARRPTLWGFILTLISVVAFACAAPIAKTMYAAGWTAGSVVITRLLGCAVVLLIPSLWLMRGRWAHLWSNKWRICAYGLISMAGVQLLFFLAVERLRPSIALLLEMTAPLMIVLFIWARTRVTPAVATFVGMVLAMVGVIVVLDPRGAALDPVGVLYALAAACCLAAFFVMSAKADMGISAIPLLGFGMGIGAVIVALACLFRVVPYVVAATPISVATFEIPWWQGLGLIVVVTVIAYVTGVMGLRLIGATVGSFLNLLEVPSSVLASWWMLGDLPAAIQLVGGVIVLAGIVFVKLGENSQFKRERVDVEQERVTVEQLDPVTGQLPVVVDFSDTTHTDIVREA